LLRLFALLLLASGSAQALEKCIAADGSVSYVDVCPPGTKRAPSKTDPTLIPGPSGTLPRKPAAPAAAPAAEPRTARKPVPVESPPLAKDVRLEFYEVQADSFSRARTATNERASGPVQSAWRMTYEYKTRQSPGRCSLGSLSTKLELVLTLPRWTPPPGAPEAEIELWRNYVDALRLREDLRFDHARNFEGTLPAELLALPPAESCAAFEEAMRTRYEALRAQTQARFADHR
jgi:hypothetical protein